MVEWSQSNQEDLLWWSDPSNLLQGVSPEEVRPNLLFRSDTSDQEWDAHLPSQFVLGLWSQTECSMSINLQELRAIRLELHHFYHLLQGVVVRVFANNTTDLSYVRKRGRSPRHSMPKPSSFVGQRSRDHSGSPVHYGVPECGHRLVELSPSGPRVRMDPLPGRCQLGRRQWTSSPRHELSPAGLFLPI